MVSEAKLKIWLGLILQAGIFISTALVMVGGIIFLSQHGSENLKSELVSSINYDIDMLTIWHSKNLFSSVGLIELGLLCLVATQVFRVGLLCYFYAISRDYWFVFFSVFILCVILYSLIWPH